MISFSSVVILLAASAGAQTTGLGRISFPTSGPPEAQRHFLRGLLLLHSFEYDDARDEFRIAEKMAPAFAMAYWGEAMTFNEPIWFFQDRVSAQAALKRLALTREQRQARAVTAREKGYVQAVEVLFGEGEKEGRDVAYAEQMRQLHERYPEDPDAAAFYALALLATCHQGRDFRVYMKAAAVLEEVFQKNPEHPGVLHYLIHCYDDPVHAPLGLRAARLYAKVAPEAAHALHMPSHIFVAMGMWNEVVASNRDSWAASEARRKRRNLPLEDRGYHALWWLEYSYLQLGRFEEARRALEMAEQDVKASPSRLIRFHLAQMCAAYAIETGRPCAATAGIDTSDLDLPAPAGDLLATGIVSLNRGQRAEAERALVRLRGLGDTASHGRPAGPASPHDHIYAGDLQAVAIMEKELEALLLMNDGKSEQALRLMREATALEDSMSFEFGPPVPQKPSHELFGEILLQLEQADAARAQFERALIRAPKRALSLLGLARAYTQMGNRAEARQTYTELRKMWSGADAELQKALDDTLAKL